LVAVPLSFFSPETSDPPNRRKFFFESQVIGRPLRLEILSFFRRGQHTRDVTFSSFSQGLLHLLLPLKPLPSTSLVVPFSIDGFAAFSPFVFSGCETSDPEVSSCFPSFPCPFLQYPLS